MSLRHWTRGARLSYALRNPVGGFARIPDAPAVVLRDLWPGNAAVGERLVRNRTEFDGVPRALKPGQWDDPSWPVSYRRWLQGFTWLQDLRELGADSARVRARTLVGHWLRQPPMERALADPAITGTRLAAWLGCYEFFAASADDRFHHNLMASFIMEARSIAALMPEAVSGWRALSALKGLLAVGVCLPDYPEFLARYLRLIDETLASQIHADGSHFSRSPEEQFQVVRELAEMLYILQMAKLPVPTALLDAANRATPALRALRHGDGGLALFNGSTERDPTLLDHVLSRASRTRVVAASLPESGFVRMTGGRALLLADAGAPAPAAFSHAAHAGMLSFEFSSGRQRIIVNCGSSQLPGWTEVLRYPPAHSVLDMIGASPMRIEADGTVANPPRVTRSHVTHDGAHWLEMTHDGYKRQGKGLYYRQLYLSKDGQSLRGEEKLRDARQGAPFCLRFHLHPDIMVEATPEGYLLHTEEESWQFLSDAIISVEESVYLGRGKVERTRQIVLTLTPPPAAAEPGPAAQAEASGAPDQPAGDAGKPPAGKGPAGEDGATPGREDKPAGETTTAQAGGKAEDKAGTREGQADLSRAAHAVQGDTVPAVAPEQPDQLLATPPGEQPPAPAPAGEQSAQATGEHDSAKAQLHAESGATGKPDTTAATPTGTHNGTPAGAPANAEPPLPRAIHWALTLVST
ncbi:heparinase II/III family protein [Acetobacter sp. TBRC 12305]|uniref:Heparinase II/III family protein n=1 Tax=Acetobacter garciniae TaxID=2817435 RepID=A0A939HLP7_9PROT|nr:heparinase II/III family protein [Acetobacter garciniae]MBO1323838.1 heparinase II/III family protein [Acetobacter garciniae]MBX0343527.1 heparinase II/III family protein [Acetobacter garciniae]